MARDAVPEIMKVVAVVKPPNRLEKDKQDLHLGEIVIGGYCNGHNRD